MALYRYAHYLHDSDQRVFDVLHRPGEFATNSGVYRCAVCGVEIIVEAAKPLPPKHHHIHAEELGQIQWRLIVLAQPHGGLEIASEGGSTPSRSPGRELVLEVDDGSTGEEEP
jgi:hypothetical protein